MTYHDDIITIKLCRGELAVSLGERGKMVKDWGLFANALERELSHETGSRDDGHTGSSAVGDLLIDRVLMWSDKGVGLDNKPLKTGSKYECWPWSEKWFDGGGK